MVNNTLKNIFQCMLEQTDAITNDPLEPITFVLAYPPPHCIFFLKEELAKGFSYDILCLRPSLRFSGLLAGWLHNPLVNLVAGH